MWYNVHIRFLYFNTKSPKRKDIFYENESFRDLLTSACSAGTAFFQWMRRM